MEKINLNTIRDIVWNRKAPIMVFTILVAACAFVYFFAVAQKRYKAGTSILFSSKPQIGSMFNVESLGSFMSNTMLQGSDMNFKAVLESNRIRSKVFSRPEILSQYEKIPGFKNKPLGVLVADESDYMSLTLDNKVMYITFEAPSKQLSADVANAYAEELIAFVNSQQQDLNRLQREFLEKEIKTVGVKMTDLEDIIRTKEEKDPELLNPDADIELVKRYSSLNTQKEQILIQMAAMETKNETGTGVYDWAMAANQVTETMASDPAIILLRQKLSELNLELAQKSQLLDDNHPTIVALKAQIAGCQQEIAQQIRKHYKGQQETLDSVLTVLNDYQSDIQAFPAIKMEYRRLYREQEILEKVYELMRKEYEKLRIDEKRTDYSLAVLDKAAPPRRKHSPQTVKSTLVSAAAAFFFMSYLFIMVDMRKMRVSAG